MTVNKRIRLYYQEDLKEARSEIASHEIWTRQWYKECSWEPSHIVSRIGYRKAALRDLLHHFYESVWLGAVKSTSEEPFFWIRCLLSAWSTGQLMMWIHWCTGQGTWRLKTFVSLGWASFQTKLRRPCHFKGVYYFLVKSKGRNITDERRLERLCKASCINQVKMKQINFKTGAGSHFSCARLESSWDS